MRRNFTENVALVLACAILTAGPSYAGSYGFPSKAEDAATASGDLGFPNLFKRKDSGNETADAADLDYMVPSLSPGGHVKAELQATSRRTYAFSTAWFTPDATSPTDLFEMMGSASTTVKIHKIFMAYPCTASGNTTNFRLVKTSAAGLTGTSVAATAVPLDSSNAAATATAKHYTDSPGTIGTEVATINTVSTSGQTNASAASGAPPIVLFDAAIYGQPIVLRGTAQGVTVKTESAAAVGNTGPKLSFTVIFTEE